MTDIQAALLGGTLIGLSAATLLVFNGQVAGISGMVGRLARPGPRFIDLAFLLGLVVGPAAFLAISGRWPTVRVTSEWTILIVAGLLVGFGARMGSGCTSGHGVIGLARLSPRSVAAVVAFLASGVLTVTLSRWAA